MTPIPIIHTERRRLAAILFSAGVMPLAVQADETQSRIFNLAAGAASEVLPRFAEQAGVEVVFSPTTAARVRTRALAGRMTPQAALQALLEGTGLKAERSARTGAFTIITERAQPVDGTNTRRSERPVRKETAERAARRTLASLFAGWLAVSGVSAQVAPTGAAEARNENQAVVLTPFTVRSDSDVGYYASNAISATRINVPLVDLPMSINVVTSEFMEDTAAFSLDEALKFTAGVKSEGFNSNVFVVRGFTAGNAFRDGFSVPGQANEVPSSIVDRVEVVKGPTALLYGQGTAGGVVNFVTKKPQATRKGTVRAFYGTKDSLRGEIDLTGPLPTFLGPNWQAMYRLAAHQYSADTHLDFHHISDFAVHPMLALIYRRNTRLDLQFTYQRIKHHAIPEAIGALAPVPLTDPRFAGLFDAQEVQRRVGAEAFARLRASPGYANVSQSYNPEPPWAGLTRKERAISATLQHSFSPSITLRSVGMYWDHRNLNHARVGSVETAARPGVIAQQGALRFIESYASSVQTDLTARFKLGPTENQAVLGHLWRRGDERLELLRDTDLSFPINRSPVFPDDYFLPDPTSIRNGTARWNGLTTNNNISNSDFNFFVQNRINETERHAIYALDLVEFFDRRLSLLGGVRIENIDGSAVETLKGPQFAGGPTLSRTPNLNQHSRQLAQAAILFKPLPDVSVYAAYSESYQPNGAFPDTPQEGSGYDLGVKFSLLKSRLSGRLSYFDIDLANVQRNDLSNPDPALRNFAVLTKGEASRGWEFDLFYSPTENLQFVVSWAHTDSEVKDNPEAPDLVGLPLVETPRRDLNVFGTYRFRGGWIDGFRVGAGLSSRSAMRSFPAGERRHIMNPAIDRIDAFADYRQKLGGNRAITYRINLKNITDETYILHHKWGPGFEWVTSIAYEF